MPEQNETSQTTSDKSGDKTTASPGDTTSGQRDANLTAGNDKGASQQGQAGKEATPAAQPGGKETTPAQPGGKETTPAQPGGKEATPGQPGGKEAPKPEAAAPVGKPDTLDLAAAAAKGYATQSLENVKGALTSPTTPIGGLIHGVQGVAHVLGAEDKGAALKQEALETAKHAHEALPGTAAREAGYAGLNDLNKGATAEQAATTAAEAALKHAPFVQTADHVAKAETANAKGDTKTAAEEVGKAGASFVGEVVQTALMLEGAAKGGAEKAPAPEAGGKGNTQPLPAAAEGAGKGNTQPLPASAEGAGKGNTQPLPASAEGAGKGNTQPLPASAEGAGKGNTQPLPAAEGAGKGNTQPLPAAEGAGKGNTQPLPAAESGGKGNTQPLPAAESGGKGNTQPLGAGPPQGQVADKAGSSGTAAESRGGAHGGDRPSLGDPAKAGDSKGADGKSLSEHDKAIGEMHRLNEEGKAYDANGQPTPEYKAVLDQIDQNVNQKIDEGAMRPPQGQPTGEGATPAGGGQDIGLADTVQLAEMSPQDQLVAARNAIEAAGNRYVQDGNQGNVFLREETPEYQAADQAVRDGVQERADQIQADHYGRGGK